MKKTRKKTGTTAKDINSFGNNFLEDFRLLFSDKPNHWEYSKRATERFHQPVAYNNPNGSEDDVHFGMKQLIHSYIYDNYYLQKNGCQYLVTTELQQMINPFYSYIDGKIPVFFTLDICIIREKDHQVFVIEIDGPEHYTRRGRMKAEIRDEWLKERYGVLTLRIDKDDGIDGIDYKKIDKFIAQPAVKKPTK